MQIYRTASEEEQDNLIFKALVASLALHSVLVVLEFSTPEQKKELKDEAIKVTMAMLPTPAAAPVPVPVPAVKPKAPKVVDAGTVKKVEKSKALGDTNAKKVQNVQKGDPASKVKTAYKPGTDFRKLKAASIGSGGLTSASQTNNQSGGSGDTYKAPNFAVKNLSAKTSGSRFTLKSVDDGGSGAGSGGGIGDGVGRGFGTGMVTGTSNGTIEKAKILNNMGSLTGSTVGAIDTSKGAEGLSSKGTIAMADVPGDTYILGNIDPDTIRRILMNHLAQFRYCYQSELEREKSDKFSGLLNLNFNINPQGNTTGINVTGASSINSSVKGCVAGVLRGISFPAPRGGGMVEVKQPVNFYPKYN